MPGTNVFPPYHQARLLMIINWLHHTILKLGFMQSYAQSFILFIRLFKAQVFPIEYTWKSLWISEGPLWVFLRCTGLMVLLEICGLWLFKERYMLLRICVDAVLITSVAVKSCKWLEFMYWLVLTRLVHATLSDKTSLIAHDKKLNFWHLDF